MVNEIRAGTAERPVIIEVGALAVRDNEIVVGDQDSGWVVEDPTRPVGYRFGPGDPNSMFGRSAKELHTLAHGASCRCPVYGFQVSNRETTWAYDSPVPYTWAT